MVEIKALVNHSLPANPDDVTGGYYGPSVEHLTECVARVTQYMVAKMTRQD